MNTEPRVIESAGNPVYKDLVRLLGRKGIRDQNKALVSGRRLVPEILNAFSDRVLAWISPGDRFAAPENMPQNGVVFHLSPELFRELDVFGTRSGLLVVSTPELGVFNPADGLSPGMSILTPLQDPENVGALVRSAVAFGADRVILLEESAHPFHPKAIRASGGAVLRMQFEKGPSMNALPDSLPLIPLSANGRDIDKIDFPSPCGLLLGQEGPGLPPEWMSRAVSIPILPAMESLNASVAAGIALYLWAAGKKKA